MDKVLVVLAGVALVLLLSLLAIKVGWSLFIVPVFNLPDLTWMQALGFSLLASAFRSSTSSKE